MEIYIGVDVGKFNLDICYLNENLQVTNDSNGIANLIKNLKKNIPSGDNIFVVCEATGGYEQLLTRTLLQHTISFHIAHPNKVRAFAKTKGILAKTDKIDAIILRDYGALMHPQPSKNLSSESVDTIRSLMKRRDQLLNDQRREQARLDKLTSDDIRSSIQSHINWITKEINNIDVKIDVAGGITNLSTSSRELYSFDAYSIFA
jgi:transposase